MGWAYNKGWFLSAWDLPFPSQELIGVIAALRLPAGADVLDVGCGAGREAIFLAEQGYHVTGVDISTEGLTIARERARKAGVDVNWQHGNALELPVGDESIDFINDRGCFHSISEKDRREYVKEMERVLKSGACLLIRGCRDPKADHFVTVSEQTILFYFQAGFECGPVLPIQICTANDGFMDANLAILRRK